MFDFVDSVTRERGEPRRPLRDGMLDLAREINAHPACTVTEIRRGSKKEKKGKFKFQAYESGFQIIFIAGNVSGVPFTAMVEDFAEWATLKRVLEITPPTQAKSKRIKASHCKRGGGSPFSVQAIRTGDFIEVRKFAGRRHPHMEYTFNVRHWPPMPVDQHALIAEYEREMYWRVRREEWGLHHDYTSVVDAIVKAVNEVLKAGGRA